MSALIHGTREAWLRAAVAEMKPWVDEHAESPVPDNLHAIVSWPVGGNPKTRIGECLAPSWTKDGSTFVYVSPVLDEPLRVLDVLLHELIHATGIYNHGKDFRKIALALGFEGKMVSTTASPELVERLRPVAERLGPYPHPALSMPGRGGKKDQDEEKKSKYVMLVSPEDPDYVVRVAIGTYDRVGPPLCPVSRKPMIPREKGG